jgi:hypothetical protein
MGTDLEPQQAFEEKLADRIRSDIGKLMPDEALAKIVERALEKAFFAETVTHDSWGRQETKPPWVTEIVKELLAKKVHKATLEYLQENEEKVQEILNERLSHGLISAITQSLDRFFQDALSSFQIRIAEQLQRS